MAKVASAFGEFPGMEAMLELQKKLEKLCYPSWLRQLDKIESVQRQLSTSLSAYEALSPAVLNSASAIAQAWPDDRVADVLRHTEELNMAFAQIAPTWVQYSELQSALSDRLSEWCAISETMQSASLAQQQAHAVEHLCTLSEDLINTVVADDVVQIDLPSELSAEDKQLLADEVSAALAPQKNWERRLKDRMAKFQENHPVLAPLLFGIILNLLTDAICLLFSTAIGQVCTPAKVYEKPQTTSQVVYHLEPLQEVKIIGEQPYYFQIELTDNDTGDTLIGFVSKRSLKVADTEEETSVQN